MTHCIREIVLRVTAMEGCADVMALPELDSPHIILTQTEDEGEDLIEWSQPKGDSV